MIRKFFILFFLGFSDLRSPTAVRRLTLKEAEQRFLKCNLSLLAERYNVDIAQARLLQAGLFDNPVISSDKNVYNRLMESTLTSGKKGRVGSRIEQVIRLARDNG